MMKDCMFNVFYLRRIFDAHGVFLEKNIFYALHFYHFEPASIS